MRDAGVVADAGSAGPRRGDEDDARYVSLTTGPWKHRLEKITKAEHWGVLLGRALAIIAATRQCTCGMRGGHTDRCFLLLAAELEAEAAAAGIRAHVRDIPLLGE